MSDLLGDLLEHLAAQRVEQLHHLRSFLLLRMRASRLDHRQEGVKELLGMRQPARWNQNDQLALRHAVVAAVAHEEEVFEEGVETLGVTQLGKNYLQTHGVGAEAAQKHDAALSERGDGVRPGELLGLVVVEHIHHEVQNAVHGVARAVLEAAHDAGSEKEERNPPSGKGQVKEVRRVEAGQEEHHVVLDGKSGGREVGKEHGDHLAVLIEGDVLGQLCVTLEHEGYRPHERSYYVRYRFLVVAVDDLTNITSISNNGRHRQIGEAPLHHVLHRHGYRITLLLLAKQRGEEGHWVCHRASTQ